MPQPPELQVGLAMLSSNTVTEIVAGRVGVSFMMILLRNWVWPAPGISLPEGVIRAHGPLLDASATA